METRSSGEGQTRNPQRAAGELVSNAATVNARRAVKARHIVTINRPRHEVFRVARAWVGRLPDVELVNEDADELVAWKTSRTANAAHAGSVNLNQTADGATEARIEIDYEPPGVAFGALFDELTNELLNTR